MLFPYAKWARSWFQLVKVSKFSTAFAAGCRNKHAGRMRLSFWVGRTSLNWLVTHRLTSSCPSKHWLDGDVATLANNGPLLTPILWRLCIYMQLISPFLSPVEPKIFIQAVLNPFDWRAFCQKVRMIQRDLAPIMNRSWRLRESRTGLSLRRLWLEFGANVLDLDYLLVAIFRMYKACSW